MKKFFAVIVALAVVISAFSLVGCAPKEDPDFDFTLLTDGTYAVSVKEEAKQAETLTVPSEYDGVAVTSLSRRAFYGMKKLTGITLPETVTSVGVEAFKGCTALTEIDLTPVTKLAKSAFEDCASLKKVTLGQIAEIPDWCFADCGALTDIALPDTLEKVGNYAFSQCTALSSVVFPTQKTLKIGDYAYSYAGITELKIPANATLGKYTFDHLAWDESASDTGESGCSAVYFYATQPTVDTLGVNSIGYTWDRADFKVFVPNGTLAAYTQLCEQIKAGGDDAWVRCVTSLGKLCEFDPVEMPY